MTFLEVCTIFEKLEKTSSRNEMANILQEALQGLDAVEIQIFSYMVQGRIAPMFIPSEFNLSEKGLLNSLSMVYGVQVVEQRKKEGDLGLVVEKIVGGEGEGLSLSDVYEILWEFVRSQGKGSVEHKNRMYISTLEKMSALESRYFTRLILGKLRLGSSTRTLLDAFSQSISGDKGNRELLDRAYGACADIGYISSLVKKDNVIELLKSTHPLPGVPILSRLVERVKSFEEVGERFDGAYMVQPKYDGLRCQIHKLSADSSEVESRVWYGKGRVKDSLDMFGSPNESSVRLFTRNLEDITEMFPEIVESAMAIKADSFILDSEIVGWDSSSEKFLSYQDTMTRRRKYGVSDRQADIPVNAFVFDIMYLNRESLLETSSSNRFGVVREVIGSGVQDIQLSPCDEVSGVDDLKALFTKYVEAGLEGVIVKSSSSLYTPGVRDFEWIKIKKSIDSNLVDTVDLVVLGYYAGSGKRSKFGIGAILGGVYNAQTQSYDSVAKIGTGITDVQWGTIKERLDSIAVDEVPKNVLIEATLQPDVYVYPEVVITVDADEVSINRSSEMVAKGLSLRFPRLIEFDRDKGVDEITTVDELYSMKK